MIDVRPLNIAAHLTAMAQSRPYATAVVCPAGRDRAGRPRYTHWTFQQLDRECDLLARGLTAIGIGVGVRAVLMVKPSLEFFALTFALFKAGAVPVLIDPGIGLANIKRCLAEVEPAGFIGIGKAQLARRLLGWAKATVRHVVTVGPTGPFGDHRLDAVRAIGAADLPFACVPPREGAVDAILFTSGSTGPPKGVEYTHANFAMQVETLRSLYAIEPGEIDLCTFPLFALFAPALGMTAVIPEMDASRPARVDPTKIIEAIDGFGVTNMFGSPALLNRVGRYGAERGLKLPTLRRVISAGAPVSARVIERFATMLEPDAQIFTPYGATEALPVSSIGSHDLLDETRHATDRGAGVCVGPPVDGVQVEIIRITDEPIPVWSETLLIGDGQIGEIAVRGANVTRGYFARADATRLAKISVEPDHSMAEEPGGEARSGPSAGFFHRMGDLGYRDVRGRIWFCGRKAHRVVSADGVLFTIPCEAVFNTHADVERTALVGVGEPGNARPVLCVELKRRLSRSDRDRVRRELLAIGATHAHTRNIATILFHPGFPVDIRHNAKIFREKLAVWAARRVR